MCGPLALALPVGRTHTARGITRNFLYQSGRLVTYGFIGLLIGLLGSGFQLAGAQKGISIAAGALMVIMAFLPLHLSGPFGKTKAGGRWNHWIQETLGLIMKKKSNLSLFLFGLINGLLPCGLVYVALAGAIAIGNPMESALFMILFGSGTVPLMFITVLAGGWISGKSRVRFQRVVPYVVAIIGILMMLRGMGLGIKYISPADPALEIHQTSVGNTDACH
jgi:hypothetical protein